MENIFRFMIYIGLSGLELPHLKKYFKEEKSRIEQYNREYQFVELHSTYNATPNIEILKRWGESTSDNFIFSGTMHKSVTLSPQKLNKEKIVNHLEKLSFLKKKMNFLLLYYNYKFKKSEENIASLLLILDVISPLFDGHILLEFQHHSWYGDDPEFKEKLKKYSSSLVNSERQLVPYQMRDPDVFYLRLAGDKDIVPTSTFGNTKLDKNRDIEYWAKYLKALQKKHKLIYVSIDNHFSGDAYMDLQYLAAQLKKLHVEFH